MYAEREWHRLDTITRLGILDTPPEEFFDTLVWMTAQLCGVPIAAFSIIDSERQWFKAKVGLDVTETPRHTAFCDHTIRGHDLLIIENAREDARFRDNPLVVDAPFIAFYAGAPIRARNGAEIGSLCVIDNIPRTLLNNERQALERGAATIEEYIHQRQRLATPRPQGYSDAPGQAQRPLLGADAAETRHRVTNLFASIQSTCALLLDESSDGDTLEALHDIQHAAKSAAHLLNLPYDDS